MREQIGRYEVTVRPARFVNPEDRRRRYNGFEGCINGDGFTGSRNEGVAFRQAVEKAREWVAQDAAEGRVYADG